MVGGLVHGAKEEAKHVHMIMTHRQKLLLMAFVNILLIYMPVYQRIVIISS
jgi:hypothetical protein